MVEKTEKGARGEELSKGSHTPGGRDKVKFWLAAVVLENTLVSFERRDAGNRQTVPAFLLWVRLEARIKAAMFPQG